MSDRITLDEFEAEMYLAVRLLQEAMTAATSNYEATVDDLQKRSEHLSGAAVHGILLEVQKRMNAFEG